MDYGEGGLRLLGGGLRSSKTWRECPGLPTPRKVGRAPEDSPPPRELKKTNQNHVNPGGIRGGGRLGEGKKTLHSFQLCAMLGETSAKSAFLNFLRSASSLPMPHFGIRTSVPAEP